MPREKSDMKYVWDMLDAAKTAEEMVRGKSLDAYERDKPLRYAVERAIEIIGEAARATSTEFRALHPSIPWSPIIATRNIISHEYGDLQHDKVWRMATLHIPALISQLTPLLEQAPPEP